MRLGTSRLCLMACVGMAALTAISTTSARAQVADAPPSSVIIYGPEFFTGQAATSALDLVNRLPGFVLEVNDSSIRGLAGASGNLLINGAPPTSKSETPAQVLRRIEASNVDRIELIRGGAPGIDMQGRSVVANVILRGGAQIERSLETNLRVYESGAARPTIHAQFARRDGEDELEMGFSMLNGRAEAPGVRRRYDPTGTLIQDARVDEFDDEENLTLRGAYQSRVSEGLLRIHGSVSRIHADEGQVLTFALPAGASSTVDTKGEDWLSEVGAVWKRPLGTQTNLELTGLQVWRDSNLSSEASSSSVRSVFSNDGVSGESIGRAVLRHQADEKLSFDGGFEVAYNFLDGATRYEENSVIVPLPNAAVRVEELRSEATGGFIWRPSPRLSLEGTGKVEWSEISQSGDDGDHAESFLYPKGRLLFTWSPTDVDQVRLRVERDVMQLDFNDFVAAADFNNGQVDGGNAELVPPRYSAAELVYERRFWQDGTVQLSVLRDHVDDNLQLIPLTAGGEGIGNFGDYDGLAARVVVSAPLDRLGIPGARLQARASWVDSTVVDPVTGEERRGSGQYPFACRVEFDHNLPGGRWSYGGVHECNVDEYTNYRRNEIRSSRDAPMTNMYLQWKPASDLTLRVDVTNLDGRELAFSRQVFQGSRGSSPLAYTEYRSSTRNPSILFQMRRSF